MADADKKECDRCGVDFLSTPFDKTDVVLGKGISAEGYKNVSFELVDIPLIEYSASKGKPMIISTGMGSPAEIQDAVYVCHNAEDSPRMLLKCCSEYLVSWEDMHMGNIQDMAERFGVSADLSDYSEGNTVAIICTVFGACVIKKHVKLEGVESPNSKFNLKIDELAQII